MAMFGNSWKEDSKDEFDLFSHWKEGEENKHKNLHSKWKNEPKEKMDPEEEPVIKHFKDNEEYE
jgi:hypothetical protein